jgi:NADH-quinone oxidoreductase subunit F
MPGTTICGLADGAGWPVKNAIQKFRAEFEELVCRGPRGGAGARRRGLASAGAH